MSFDWNAHLQETAAHLLRMANEPGWDEHARRRRDELLADSVYGDELRQEIQRQRKKEQPCKQHK